MSTTKMPCLAFNHGGGGGNSVSKMLHKYTRSLPQAPRAVLIVEAHMQSDPILLVGDCHLARSTAALLASSGFESRLVHGEGREPHGALDAWRGVASAVGEDIPCVIMSLLGNEDPQAHIALGQAIAPLRERSCLVLGSGLPSFHNFGYWFSDSESTRLKGADHSRVFDSWLRNTLSDPQLSAKQRLSALANWERAPSATACHPVGGASHFLPLLVMLGAADGGEGRAVLDESHNEIMGKSKFKYSHFELGAPTQAASSD